MFTTQYWRAKKITHLHFEIVEWREEQQRICLFMKLLIRIAFLWVCWMSVGMVWTIVISLSHPCSSRTVLLFRTHQRKVLVSADEIFHLKNVFLEKFGENYYASIFINFHMNLSKPLECFRSGAEKFVSPSQDYVFFIETNLLFYRIDRV